MYTKEQMDKKCEEAFAEDELEKNTNIGFDPVDVVKGDKQVVEAFKKRHEAAREDKR